MSCFDLRCEASVATNPVLPLLIPAPNMFLSDCGATVYIKSRIKALQSLSLNEWGSSATRCLWFSCALPTPSESDSAKGMEMM